MKKFKLNRFGRRFWRTVSALFGLLVIFNIYYFSTLTRYAEDRPFPVTTVVYDSAYENAIVKAQNHLTSISKTTDFPSFSVAVGHRGKLVWTAAAGYQDLDAQLVATPKTQYRIGSTSKSVTATGVARAVDQGLLKLDAKLGDTITNWSCKQWDVNMRQLLSHTAGVGNYTDFGMHAAKYTLTNYYDFKTASAGLNVFDRYELLFEPGTSFSYSTFGTNLASVVLEQATSTPFLSYLEREVFQPLDMQNTYGDHDKPKTEYLATFCETDNGYYREFRSLGLLYDINLSYKWAGGGIISTPTDLVKMGMGYLKDDCFLSAETKRAFWTPQKLNNGEINEQDYALGWRSWLSYKHDLLLDGKTPVWMVHHGGVSKGSQNLLLLFPNYNLVIDVAINTNVTNFSTLSKQLYPIVTFFLEEMEKEASSLYKEIKLAAES